MYLGLLVDTNQIKVSQIIAFSDALFAFSITFMAFALPYSPLPTFPINLVESELLRKLSQLLIPNLIHFIGSFMIVGMYWINYHRIMKYFTHANLTLVWLNLLFLLFIALVAYFTALLTANSSHRIIVIIFASIMATTGLVLWIIWWYGTHNRKLVEKSMHHHLVRYILVRTAASPIIFLISIGISFINVQAAQFFWVVILPVNIIIYMAHIPHIHRP
jgi:TMEM175 potassium channel family protein